MNKKGFTLIELLAVIVILAVVAIISTPIIAGVIEESKISAFKDSVSNVVSSVDLYSEVSGNSLTDGINILDMKLTNNDLKYGKVKLVNDQLIAINMSNGNFCANGEIGMLIISEGECDMTIPVFPSIEEPEGIASSLTFSVIETEPTDGGIDHYEYYYLDELGPVNPEQEASGTSEDSDVIITEESNYVCFRIVSTSNKLGYWSCTTNNVDSTAPSINIVDESGKLKSFTLTDKSLSGYQITTTDVQPSSWNNISGTKYDGTYESATVGTYYLWAKDSYGNVSHKIFSIYHYFEPLLNGADPDLGSNMIPVTLANDGTVTYADMFDKWYEYGTKKWANIVILNTGYSYNIGDIIPEEAIESYFVWIPRYRYKIVDLGNYTNEITTPPPANFEETIEVIFESKGNETDDSVSGECTTPMLSNASGNCVVGDYMTHPAFISLNVDGIWAGKFELGYRGALDVYDGHQRNTNVAAVVVKPNTPTWRYNDASNFMYVGYNYDRANDSHMMKNTEWGSIALLSNSIYGINEEMWMNPYKVTGCVGASVASASGGTSIACAYRYNSENGYKATTTGNITGIYDMAGGTGEYLAGIVAGSVSLSGYDSKYYDNYPLPLIYGDYAVDRYGYRILGDATAELGPIYYNASNVTWYSDEAYALSGDTQYKNRVWAIRGGQQLNSYRAGIFAFNGEHGTNDVTFGTRIVLS